MRDIPDNELWAEVNRRLGRTEQHQDVLYAAFEETFRGSRSEIKQNQRVYLPYIDQVGAGSPVAPVLDLGSGRGEWLELLREENKTARGVESNRYFLNQCQQLGLEVIHADVLEHLQGLRTSSIGAVTGFHLVEHLPPPLLLPFFQETLRVLHPGGIVIFESPNPENLQVGAHLFHIDPTHAKPLPPNTLVFLLKASGLTPLEVLRLHPCNTDHLPRSTLSPALAPLVQLLYGPQDYAVIAQKA